MNYKNNVSICIQATAAQNKMVFSKEDDKNLILTVQKQIIIQGVNQDILNKGKRI